MITAIIILILAIAALWILKTVTKITMKVISLVLIVFFLIGTVSICVSSPKMHKPFSINVIEYLIKINDDGTMSTTKQTTQTVIHKRGIQK